MLLNEVLEGSFGIARDIQDSCNEFAASDRFDDVCVYTSSRGIQNGDDILILFFFGVVINDRAKSVFDFLSNVHDVADVVLGSVVFCVFDGLFDEFHAHNCLYVGSKDLTNRT